MNEPLPLRYRPAVYYFRRAIRESKTLEGLREIAELQADEIELLKAQIREMGGIPKRLVNPRQVGPDGVVLPDEM